MIRNVGFHPAVRIVHIVKPVQPAGPEEKKPDLRRDNRMRYILRKAQV